MPISRSILEQQSQANVILAAGYEFMCDVLQRFLESDLPERETFLLARLDDGSYRVERFDRVNAQLTRLGEDAINSELYRPLTDLAWLPAVFRVAEISGDMNDADVAKWKRRREGKALVVVDGGEFLALVYEPPSMRSSSRPKPLRDIFPRWIGATSAEAAGEESFEIAKGLEAMPPRLERELAMAAPDDPAIFPLPMTGSAPSAAANGGGQPAPPALTVPFHTDIRFAQRLKPGETRPLTVQLTKEAAPQSVSDAEFLVPFQEEFTAETIHVHLDAPGFAERANTWQRSIQVFSFQDSDRATFILTAGQEEGERQISLDFRHAERLIGNARFVVQVSSQPVSASPAATDALTFRQPAPSLNISPAPPAPSDVELRIRVDGKRLTFELHSPHQAVDATHAPMGGVELATEPQAYMQERFDELNNWAKSNAAGADASATITKRLTAIGNSLYIALFPDKLKRAYWKLVKLRQQGLLSSLHIISDEPWIPWEMVKPVDEEEGTADDFLAQGWQLSRWLAGPGQADGLIIGAARLVAPDTGLSTEREKQFFAALAARHISVAEPLRQLAQVWHVAEEGVELLHFSTHGQVNSQSIDRSAIVLEDNAELRPDDLLGEAVLGLRKRRALIFLNTCHGARMGFSLAGLGGWASQMINQVRAGVFIGALWEVNDELAADFALAFYAELQAGKRLGEAFHTARMGIRESAPANSTWLAYTLYGDPNMRVGWGGKATDDSGRPTADDR